MKDTHHHAQRELQRPRELSTPQLVHSIPALLALACDLALRGDGEFPLCTSIWTSSFLNPGNSNVTVMVLDSVLSWRSVLGMGNEEEEEQ